MTCGERLSDVCWNPRPRPLRPLQQRRREDSLKLKILRAHV